MSYRSKITVCFFLVAVALGQECKTTQGYWISLTEEELATKITRYFNEKLVEKSETTLTDYVCELQAFIPLYTQHTLNTVRPLLLNKIDIEIAYYKKRREQSMNFEDMHTGFKCLTTGIITGILTAIIDDFLYGQLRKEKDALKNQFNILERVEHTSRDRTRTTFIYRGLGLQSAECTAALARCREIWLEDRHIGPKKVIPVLALCSTTITTCLAIPIGLQLIVSNLRNPQYLQRYQKLCLFKKLLEETQQYDKYMYPTPMIVDFDFFMHA
jgi:hypothetical protein